MKLIKRKESEPGEEKQGFIDFVLFNPKSFNILSALSYSSALFICTLVTAFAIMFKIHLLSIIFGVLTVVALRNLYKNRFVFKALRRDKEDEYLDITLADSLNSIFHAKDDEAKEKEKWD